MRPVGTGRLLLVLWPLGIAAEVAALVFLFRGNDDVTAVAIVNRSVGGSFIACGLIAWQLRPDSRTGPLMTLTGFLYLSEALLFGFTLIAVLAGVGAAVMPARRASRLNVLEALQYE
jgi:ABC-type antimicrobial peptide transport system permease subunit